MTMRGRSWKIAGSIQHGGNPFSSLGLDWCTHCRMEVDTDTDAEYNDGTYVYRRRCCRCGRVIKWGAYAVPMVNAELRLPTVLTWVTERGKDRSR